MQMLQRMGWKGAGLGAEETGIVEPVKGGEVRDRADMYRGMGNNQVSQDYLSIFTRRGPFSIEQGYDIFWHFHHLVHST